MSLAELRAFYPDRPCWPVPTTPKSLAWEKGFVEVVDAQTSEKVPLSAYVKEGLAVHHAYKGRGWTVTHRSSGCGFTGRYPTKAKAIAKAEQLLCIEGLWDQPLQAFANGLSETDTTRLNAILHTEYKPHKVSASLRKYMESQGIRVRRDHVR